MKILLMDGRVLWIPEATNINPINHNKECEVLGPRKRALLTFTSANIVAWWWDNEQVQIEAKAQ